MENENLQDLNETEIAEAGKNLPDNPQSETVKNLELIKEFNNILGNHIERLLDTRFGIEELELNIFSVSCIVLLTSRETEIETFPALPPPRYTESSLITELSEMSIEPDSEIIKVIESMGSKNYLKITDERIFCNKPMISMAQLFDRIFPNMPGLNFVAYLGQMIDEVTATRKTTEEASRQFNQMLEIQGMPINETAAKSTKKKFSYLKLEDESLSERKVVRQTVIPVKPVNIFSQLKTVNIIKSPVMAKGHTFLQVEKDARDNPDSVYDAGTHTGCSEPEVTLTSPDTITDNEPGVDSMETENITDSGDLYEKVSDGFEPPDDRLIEDRILEFEEQLGLKCPLCGTGGIKTNETAKGKTYYHCSNSECNFISWGKPFYFECPKCNSNFLIEVTDSNGKSFLKCPKATCTHWQKFPWDITDQDSEHQDGVSEPALASKKPKRKVRRRVVRRRRQA